MGIIFQRKMSKAGRKKSVKVKARVKSSVSTTCKHIDPKFLDVEPPLISRDPIPYRGVLQLLAKAEDGIKVRKWTERFFVISRGKLSWYSVHCMWKGWGRAEILGSIPIAHIMRGEVNGDKTTLDLSTVGGGQAAGKYQFRSHQKGDVIKWLNCILNVAPYSEQQWQHKCDEELLQVEESAEETPNSSDVWQCVSSLSGSALLEPGKVYGGIPFGKSQVQWTEQQELTVGALFSTMSRATFPYEEKIFLEPADIYTWVCARQAAAADSAEEESHDVQHAMEQAVEAFGMMRPPDSVWLAAKPSEMALSQEAFQAAVAARNQTGAAALPEQYGSSLAALVGQVLMGAESSSGVVAKEHKFEGEIPKSEFLQIYHNFMVDVLGLCRGKGPDRQISANAQRVSKSKPVVEAFLKTVTEECSDHVANANAQRELMRNQSPTLRAENQSSIDDVFDRELLEGERWCPP